MKQVTIEYQHGSTDSWPFVALAKSEDSLLNGQVGLSNTSWEEARVNLIAQLRMLLARQARQVPAPETLEIEEEVAHGAE